MFFFDVIMTFAYFQFFFLSQYKYEKNDVNVINSQVYHYILRIYNFHLDPTKK